MGAETRTRQFSERTIRQVRLDCNRAIIRARLCPRQSEVLRLRCVDEQAESEVAFGNQLWYFEGIGVDGEHQSHSVFGVVEYSIQFGLYELVDDGVFDSEHQRERFRHLYQREVHPPSWRQPAHRFLAIGFIAVAVISSLYLLIKILSN